MCRFYIVYRLRRLWAGLKVLHRTNKEIKMAIADLTAVVAKIAADVDAFVAADQAKDAQIADLKNQLAAFQNDGAAIDAATAALTAADAKLVVPAA